MHVKHVKHPEGFPHSNRRGVELQHPQSARLSTVWVYLDTKYVTQTYLFPVRKSTRVCGSRFRLPVASKAATNLTK